MKDERQMEEKIKKARLKRSTARTDANETSSRSHAIFHIQICSTHSDKKKARVSTGSITFVDLAGSERVNQSNTEGERLAETKAINLSLTALRDVISALCKKEKHIPYRNSKLTFILQNYLGKDSKTLVIINISPCLSHILQTIGSLNFGCQLKSVSIPKGTKAPLSHLSIFDRSNSGAKGGSLMKGISTNRKMDEERRGLTREQGIEHRMISEESPQRKSTPMYAEGQYISPEHNLLQTPVFKHR